MGASTVVARARSPCTSARYSRWTVRAAKLPDQIGLRFGRLGDHQQAARVLVEPVHDARARQRRQRRRVMQQRVEQRAVAIAAARMHDQSGRLVDDEQRRVLVDDRQRDRLRDECRVRRGCRGRDQHRLAAAQVCAAATMTTASPTLTCPASIQPFNRLRECCGSSCASVWSRRLPAAAAGTTSPCGAEGSCGWAVDMGPEL